MNRKYRSFLLCTESLATVALLMIVAVEITKGQDFRIDNQLRVLANDCYTRIAIGSRLPREDVISTISGNSLSDCERACSMNRTVCDAFSFGIDARGNGTCAIGRMNASTRIQDLRIDQDYDVYERRARLPGGCQYDRLLRIGYGEKRGGMNSSVGQENNPSGVIKNGRPGGTTRFSNFFDTSVTNASKIGGPGQPSFFRGGWYAPIADDTDARLYDILNNKKSFVTIGLRSLSEGISDETPRDVYPWLQSVLYSSEATDLGKDLCSNRARSLENIAIYCKSNENRFLSPSRQDLSYVIKSKDSPEHETRSQQQLDDTIGNLAGFGTKIQSILDQSTACYRKLLTGKRLSENHVRRNVRCDRIEDCHRVCEYESTFVCKGFNYGRLQPETRYGERGGGNLRGYMCQLTSVSGARMDQRRDFVDDSRYDYYERDWQCPAEKAHRDTLFESDWSSHLQPARRPIHQENNRWEPASPPPPPSSSRRPFPSLLPPQSTRYYYLPERRERPSDYGYYGATDPPPRVSYLPQGPNYNEIIQQAHHPPGRVPPPSNDYYRYYYYGTLPNRRTDQERGWRDEPPGPNDIAKPNSRNFNGGYPANRYEGSRDYPISEGRDDYYPRAKSREPPRKPSSPEQHDNHYGYNYGPAYGYDAGREATNGHGQTSGTLGQKGLGSQDCSVRSLTGFKISRNIIVASHTTANLEECEMLCGTRTDCLTFAYRYSLVATSPADNCLASNVPFEKLNFYTDLEPDRDYDVYAMIGDPKNCHGEAGKPNAGEVTPRTRSSEGKICGCPARVLRRMRVKSGCGMPPSLTRKETRVHNGLGECQMACINARLFTCRSFVFRYDSAGDREANCFLSDCPTSEIISAVVSDRGLSTRDRQDELYERGSYGRGCEVYPFATIYNSASFGEKPKLNDHQGCYSGYQGGCKLSPYAVSSMSRVDSENECRRQCSKMRLSQHSSPCMSFSFKLGDEKRGDNCYLSDVPRRDLRPGFDYTYDDDYVMYAWKELEPQCSFGHGTGYDHLPQNDGGFNYGTSNEDYRPHFTPGGSSPSLGPGTGYLGYNNIFLGVRPLEPDRPNPTSPPVYSGVNSPPHHHSDDGYSSRPSYPDGFASFNRHYTVNGYPCKRGTKCEMNQIVGFWSCEPEGSEFGSWDYCCEPNHHCGFSQGYRYPWCYVGPSEDQWRPCSDKYYPYLPSPRPGIRPQNRDLPSYRREENGQDINDSWMTHQGRHWPIAFLHPVPPPNMTDSVALANNRRDSSRRSDSSNNYTDDNLKNRASKKPSNTSDRSSTNDSSSSSSSSSEKTNSPITRIQLHKSHLKRRGLVSSNRTINNNNNDRTNKTWYKKLHRVTVIPAVKGDNETRGKNENDVRKKTKPDFDASPFTGKSSYSTNVRDNNRVTLGRVERVTRANNFYNDNDKKIIHDRSSEGTNFEQFHEISTEESTLGTKASKRQIIILNSTSNSPLEQ